jgi:hypothetical protein
MAVRDCHDLAPFATACWTNAIGPFGFAKETSIKASSSPSSPRANRSSCSVGRGSRAFVSRMMSFRLCLKIPIDAAPFPYRTCASEAPNMSLGLATCKILIGRSFGLRGDPSEPLA